MSTTILFKLCPNVRRKVSVERAFELKGFRVNVSFLQFVLLAESVLVHLLCKAIQIGIAEWTSWFVYMKPSE